MSYIEVRALRLFAVLALAVLCALGAFLMLAPALSYASPTLGPSPCTTVANTNDSGAGSLRTALGCVAPGGTVSFGLALAGQTILLTTTELVVTQTNITIDGSSAPGVKVDGNSAHRVFNVSAPLTIISLTIQNGMSFSSGGGLATGRALTLTNVGFFTNTAGGNGGGVFESGGATLNGGLFQNNSANQGGGLYTFAALALAGTRFLGNSARQGGGVYISHAGTLNGALFQNNTATNGAGGGVYALDTLALAGTQFLSNTSTSGGGGGPAGGGGARLEIATLRDVLFQGNNCGACASGGLRVNQALTLNGIVTSTDDFTVYGDFINNGAFTQAGGAVTFGAPNPIQGLTVQLISGSTPTTFSNLTINNTGGSGTVFGQNITVTGLLLLNSDLTTTGSYTLSLTANATTAGSGDVWGRTDRSHPFLNDVTYSFGSPNVSVNFPSGCATAAAKPSCAGVSRAPKLPVGTPAQMTVDLTRTVPPGSNFGSAVQRYYDIAQVGGSGFTAVLRLHYQDSELNGNTEAALQIWHYPPGGPWTAFPASASDTTVNWLENNAVTDFSPWAISQNGPVVPTAVRVESFGARGAGVAAQSGAPGLSAVGALLALAAAAALLWRRRRTA